MPMYLRPVPATEQPLSLRSTVPGPGASRVWSEEQEGEEKGEKKDALSLCGKEGPDST